MVELEFWNLVHCSYKLLLTDRHILLIQYDVFPYIKTFNPCFLGGHQCLQLPLILQSVW